jgi:hypothetical protein
VFRTLTLGDALHVVQRMRLEDRHCIRQLVGELTDEAFAINRFQTDGPAWSVWQDGKPVLVGGLQFATPWIGIAWLVATPACSLQTWRKVLRFARTVAGNATNPANPHFKQRIEAHVMQEWTAAVSFARHAGLQLEGTRRAAGRGGEDVQVWGLVARKETR